MAKIKYPNIEFSEEAMDEYYAFERACQKNSSNEDNYIKLSAEAKLYSLAMEHEADVKQEIMLQTVTQEEIDLVFNQAKINLDKHPLIADHVEAILPNIEDNANSRWQQDLQRARAMAARESARKRQSRNSIKHTSLTNLMKSDLIYYQEIVKTFEKSDVERDAGSLPPEWIALIPKEELSEKTKEISKLFQNFAEKTSSDSDINPELLDPYIADLRNNLTQTLKNDVEIEFLGSGKVTKAFKIVTDNKAVTLKTNHSISEYVRDRVGENIKELEEKDKGEHGVTSELASGIYASSSDERKNFVETYMGRVGTIYDRDTYLIRRYIDWDKEVSRNLNKKWLGTETGEIKINRILNNDLNSDNIMNGIITDMGKTYISSDLEDRKIQKLVKTLIRALPRKDGVGIVNDVKAIAAKNPSEQNKLDKAIRYIDRRLKIDMPDIDCGEIVKRPLNEDVMTAMGVSNKVKLTTALNMIYPKDPNDPTLQYIIESRGGIEEIRKTIRESHGISIPKDVAVSLVKNGAAAEDFCNLDFNYHSEEKKKEFYDALAKAEEDKQLGSQNKKEPQPRENQVNMGCKVR